MHTTPIPHPALRAMAAGCCRCLPALAALAAAPLTLAGVLPNTNTVYGAGSTGERFNTTQFDVPAVGGLGLPINLGTWGGTEAHFAAASGETLTLRSMVATQGDSNQPQTKSSFNWTKVVEAGNSGLSVGDPITVQLAFRIDGRTAGGFGVAFAPGPVFVGLPADYSLQSDVTARLKFDVADMSAPGYESGAWLARVNYVSGVNVNVAKGSPSSSYPNGYEYATVGHQVALNVIDPNAGPWDWSGNTVQSATYSSAGPMKEVFDVDTGLLNLSFDSRVGNRLNFVGALTTAIYCNSYAPVGTAPSCAGLSNFGNTFDAALSADVAGITFSNDAPGVFAPVPEPASWALMLAGAAGLLWRARSAPRTAAAAG
jgi:hypothetical protein